MSIDFKTIFLMILIIGVLGAVFYFGLQIIKEPSTDIVADTSIEKEVKHKEIEKATDRRDLANETPKDVDLNAIYSTDNTTLSQSIYSVDDLTILYGTGLSINDLSPKTDFKLNTYESYTFSLAGNTRASYYVPLGWKRNESRIIDPGTGASVECIARKTSELLEEVYNQTTYDEVLNAFMEAEKADSINPENASFTTRDITTDGGTFKVLVKRDEGSVTSYIVFVQGLYEYHLKYIISASDYNDLAIGIIDDIFKSFKIF